MNTEDFLNFVQRAIPNDFQICEKMQNSEPEVAAWIQEDHTQELILNFEQYFLAVPNSILAKKIACFYLNAFIFLFNEDNRIPIAQPILLKLQNIYPNLIASPAWTSIPAFKMLSILFLNLYHYGTDHSDSIPFIFENTKSNLDLLFVILSIFTIHATDQQKREIIIPSALNANGGSFYYRSKCLFYSSSIIDQQNSPELSFIAEHLDTNNVHFLKLALKLLKKSNFFWQALIPCTEALIQQLSTIIDYDLFDCLYDIILILLYKETSDQNWIPSIFQILCARIVQFSDSDPIVYSMDSKTQSAQARKALASLFNEAASHSPDLLHPLFSSFFQFTSQSENYVSYASTIASLSPSTVKSVVNQNEAFQALIAPIFENITNENERVRSVSVEALFTLCSSSVFVEFCFKADMWNQIREIYVHETVADIQKVAIRIIGRFIVHLPESLQGDIRPHLLESFFQQTAHSNTELASALIHTTGQVCKQFMPYEIPKIGVVHEWFFNLFNAATDAEVKIEIIDSFSHSFSRTESTQLTDLSIDPVNEYVNFAVQYLAEIHSRSLPDSHSMYEALYRICSEFPLLNRQPIEAFLAEILNNPPLKYKYRYCEGLEKVEFNVLAKSYMNSVQLDDYCKAVKLGSLLSSQMSKNALLMMINAIGNCPTCSKAISSFEVLFQSVAQFSNVLFYHLFISFFTDAVYFEIEKGLDINIIVPFVNILNSAVECFKKSGDEVKNLDDVICALESLAILSMTKFDKEKNAPFTLENVLPALLFFLKKANKEEISQDKLLRSFACKLQSGNINSGAFPYTASFLIGLYDVLGDQAILKNTIPQINKVLSEDNPNNLIDFFSGVLFDFVLPPDFSVYLHKTISTFISTYPAGEDESKLLAVWQAFVSVSNLIANQQVLQTNEILLAWIDLIHKVGELQPTLCIFEEGLWKVTLIILQKMNYRPFASAQVFEFLVYATLGFIIDNPEWNTVAARVFRQAISAAKRNRKFIAAMDKAIGAANENDQIVSFLEVDDLSIFIDSFLESQEE